MKSSSVFLRVLCGLLSLFAVFQLIACGKTQKGFLDGDYFPKSGIVFKITPPSIVRVGSDFQATVQAQSAAGENIAFYTGSLTWSVVGQGHLTVKNAPGFSGGSQTVMLNYANGSLTEGQQESIALVAKDANANTGTSATFTATQAVTHTGFAVDAPESAVTDQSFNITVRSTGAGGVTYPDFTGTVNLTTAGGNGSLSVTTANIVNGTVTLSVQYTSPTASLVITAANGSLTGNSRAISVGFGSGGNFSINPLAVPLSSTSVRLSWSPVPGATQVKVFRKIAGTYTEVQSVATTFSYWVETGLTNATLYEYRIEVYENTVLKGTGFVTATTNACTNKSGTISANETWTKAASPYCVTANVTVNASAILTLQPGTVVLFAAATSLTITAGAQLISVGNSTDLITFTSVSTTPAKGDWVGIVFDPTATGSTVNASHQYLSGSRMVYSLLEYGRQAVVTSVTLNAEYALFRYHKPAANGIDGAAIKATLDAAEELVLRYDSFLDNETNEATGGAIRAVRGTTAGETIIEKSTFVNNKSPGTAATVGYGGGVAVDGMKGTVNDSFFYSNTARYGGAVYLRNAGSHSVQRNLFDTNSATQDGGAVMFYDFGVVGDSNTINNNTFRSNTASNRGGGLYVHADCSAGAGGTTASFQFSQINNNNFASGSAVSGGAIAFFARLNNPSCGANFGRIDNNTVNNNTIAGNATNGGGIYIEAFENGNGRFVGNTISNNTFTSTATTAGGGIYLFLNSGGNANSNTIISNTFTGTTATSMGGGIAVVTGSGTVDNLRIERNRFTSTSASGGSGGGIRIAASGIAITGLQILKNEFINTSAVSGGGVSVGANYSSFGGSMSGALVTRNYFSGASATTRGGAVFLHNDDMSGGSTTLPANTVSYNHAAGTSAPDGCFFSLRSNSSSGSSAGNIVEYNTITNCSATTNGAANVERVSTAGISGTIFRYNNFSSVAATSGKIFYFGGAGGAIVSTSVQHNNFPSISPIARLNDTAGTPTTFSQDYWGQTLSAIDDCSDIPALCTGGTSTATTISFVNTAWPLCETSPGDANCVGYRGLCVNNGNAANCAGM